jgi:HlyD family secretion protein
MYIQTNNYTNQSATSTSSMDMSSLSSLASMSGSSMDLSSLLGTSSSSSSNSAVSFSPDSGNYIIIADLSKFELYPQLSESEIIQVSQGMTVELNFNLVGKKAHGKITSVLLIPSKQGSTEPTYYITVVPETIPENIPVGATVQGSILLSEKSNTLTLPVSVVNYDDNEKAFVYLLGKDNNLISQPVEIGIQDISNVEIISGIDTKSKVVEEQRSTKKTISLRPWIKNLINKK